jgi:hypothetical protein
MARERLKERSPAFAQRESNGTAPVRVDPEALMTPIRLLVPAP